MQLSVEIVMGAVSSIMPAAVLCMHLLAEEVRRSQGLPTATAEAVMQTVRYKV